MKKVVGGVFRDNRVIAEDHHVGGGKSAGDAVQQSLDRRPTFGLCEFANVVRSVGRIQQSSRIHIVDTAIDQNEIDLGRIGKRSERVVDLGIDCRLSPA